MNSTAVSLMNLAINAATNVYSTTPNPRVGCVIVRDGVIVGTGWHQKPGLPHAEVVALREAGELACGATAYVSLEPCCHHGRTPPCTDALITAGVTEVIFAMLDPNPLVAGKGAQALRDAGVKVTWPLLEDDARTLNRGFIKRMDEGLPFVRCKLAMSLDGRTAMASGESQWITGPAARADVQKLRAESCAVLTGVNTVLSDNPGLNVRAEQLQGADVSIDRANEAAARQPLRVILDSSLRTPPESKILSLPGDVLFLVGAPHLQQYARFQDSKALIREVPTVPGGRVDLRAAMTLLSSEFSCNEVLLEAGPTLGGAMIQAGLVDEVIIYIGAKFLGSDALPLLNLPGLRHMSDHVGLEIIDVQGIAGDCRITARLINR
ncbi:MAG: bifunctional diaminohydroxyphosphoribosylaminopyrimidine deaminase/5-amino-6-(5-phosphoribosylamino)uracil reductase RibD [Gammaproteobacteria bacterium]|nr:bifunctional diaminohydroxyphosphoribosylaminopyrimidine deaminase/5-amino-6-(5-phosphoribosylamino)uracil reductase RibD [Gammaproteobacteria bacterium]MDP2348597.1 bifunctional diaminohydroxyphosphoribosylaminopyrimidine deaminase/5-amino-6-(5-phosphoribosylamino)uracil reductase RibD [Gammaproteobacteria bacterium]